MALADATLERLFKEKIVKLTLGYQDNFNQNLEIIEKDISELKENFSKDELAVTK